MKRAWGWLLSMSLAAASAQAQAPPAATSLLRPTAAGVQVAAGGSAKVTVHMVIAPGWHVYSNPPSLEYNIPTRVSLAGGFGVTAGKAVYPAGREVKFASDEQSMRVYDGELDVIVPVTAAANAVNGAHTLHGKVDFQSCNNQMCLAPASVPYTVEVGVSGGVSGGVAAGAASAATPSAAESAATAPPSETVAPAPAPGAGFMTAPPADAGKSATQRRLEDALAKGWVWWVLALFLGGLALNLTPCVFPMLGITVSIFGARKAEVTARVVANAIAYVVGIMIMYTALGVVAGLTGGLFGAALQNTYVLVGLGVLLLVMSFSMFGAFEIQAPPWLLDRVGGAGTGSLAGLFLNGLAVGIIAAPCVGSLLIGVLAIIAQRGSVLFGVQTMGIISLGMGAPYLVLAMSSNLLGRLPRAGEWMDWVKKLFGVGLAAFGLSYVLLGVAPYAAQWLVPASLLLGGLYLGFMEKSGNRMKRFLVFKRVLGTAGVAASVALVLQMTAAQARGVPFRPYDEAAVQASIAAGRGVMIDFGADWCVPCHELDLEVFPDPDVITAAKPFDAYKVDLTHGNDAVSKRWSAAGVPTVVFLGPGGAEVPGTRVEGKVTAAEFAKRLRQAAYGLAGR